MPPKKQRTRSQKSPRDFTGRQAEDLQAEHADELAARQRELSMMHSAQVPVDEDGEVVDYAVENPDNQTLDVLHQAVTGEPLAPHLRGTTLQPGQTGSEPGGGAYDTQTSRNITAGTIDANGYMTVGNESVKTNSTATTGTGFETPGHSPGAAEGAEVTRGRVDTEGDTHVTTPNWGIRGLSADDIQVHDLGEVMSPGARGAGYDPVKPVEIQVNTDLENVTFGNSGRMFDFRVGRRYRVPGALAAHLEEKGYVWH